MKAPPFSLFAKEEIPLLIALGLPLLATIAFILSGGPTPKPAEQSEKDVLWVRAYVTNLQNGFVNSLAVQSLRQSRDSVIPLLAAEMQVRPHTIGKRLNDKVAQISTQFATFQASTRASDAYRAAAAWALLQIFQDPGDGRYHAATISEAQALLPFLADALNDHAVMVRTHAAATLGAFGTQRADAIALCKIALQDPEWQVRAGALNSLAGLAILEPAALEWVEQALTDQHAEVRRFARNHLRKAGRQMPDDTEGPTPTITYVFE